MLPQGLKLLFIALIVLWSGNYLNLKANNFPTKSVQVPAVKAKPAILSKSTTTTTITTAKSTPKKKKKIKKVIVKDSVVVDLDPANSNPPLFQKQ